MMFSWLEKNATLNLSILLTLTFFTLPISATAQAILINVSVVYILSLSRFWRNALFVFSRPWCIFAVAFFCVVLVSSLGSPASWGNKVLVLEKYSKMFYLPILAFGYSKPEMRQRALHAFLLAMFITCIISVMQSIGLFDYFKDDQHGFVFRNHIITSTMMAFAVYVSGYLGSQHSGRSRYVYFMLAVLFSYQLLFINTGRTGYVLFLVFMLLLIVQLFTWKRAMLFAALLSAVFLVSYQFSAVMQDRTKQAIHDWHSYNKSGKETPIGQRLLFRDYAQKLFLQNPWAGSGTASFSHYFKADYPVFSQHRKLFEPHGQYGFIAAEYGMIGLLVYLAFLSSIWIASLRLKEMKSIGIAISCAIMLCSLSDSVLFYSASGYFFILFMALCCGEQLHESATVVVNKSVSSAEAIS